LSQLTETNDCLGGQSPLFRSSKRTLFFTLVHFLCGALESDSVVGAAFNCTFFNNTCLEDASTIGLKAASTLSLMLHSNFNVALARNDPVFTAQSKDESPLKQRQRIWEGYGKEPVTIFIIWIFP
jgi:hypothetical protein